MKTVFSIVILFATLVSQNVTAQFTLSCDSFCVLSIEMDTTQPNTLAVTILNNNTGHVNYPTIQVMNANGDTLAGDTMFNFFAHIGHVQLTYYVSTILDSVPDDFTATVLLSEGIWDTVCLLTYPCTGIIDNVEEKFQDNVRVYPVPADDALVVTTVNGNEPFEFYIFDATARCVLQGTAIGSEHIRLSDISNGMYWMRITNRESVSIYKKIIVHHR